jgi:hypothetical protein
MNEIEELKNLHYKIRQILEERDYFGLVKFLEVRLFTSNISELKTILIITTPFKEHEDLKDIRQKILNRYELLKGERVI